MAAVQDRRFESVGRYCANVLRVGLDEEGVARYEHSGHVFQQECIGVPDRLRERYTLFLTEVTILLRTGCS